MKRVWAAVFACGAVLVAGCGNGLGVPGSGALGVEGSQGRVYGGQQPVVGATVQLYSVGTTADGSAAIPLLNPTVTTDSNGGFNITGQYTCASGTYVYIVATGGNPGSGTNPNLALMAALGDCGTLTATTNIVVNEVTTVAAVTALAPYMSSLTGVGSAATDALDLQSAFGYAQELANTATGASPGTGVPSGTTVPTTLINTLANVMAACVNSAGGGTGDGTACGSLFALSAQTGAAAAANTAAAVLNVVQNPTANTTALFNLMTPQAPFAPALSSAPADFRPHLGTNGTVANSVTTNVSSLNFAGTTVGNTAASQSFMLMNSGPSKITVNTITVEGPNASEFTRSGSCGPTLGSGSSCTITISATPAGAGLRTAAVVVSTSAQSPVSNATSSQYVGLTAVGKPVSPGLLTVSGTSLYRDGVAWTPHGLNSIAFVQPLGAQPGGCDGTTSNVFQTAFNRYFAMGPQLFAQMSAWGADTVRLQVSELGLASGQSLYTAQFFNSFVQAVRSARAQGLNVIVSIQDECQSGDKSTAAEPGATVQYVWSQLAPLLMNDTGIMFEMYNEPEPAANMADWQAWQTAHNAVISTIRGTGAKNVVIADGLAYATTLNGALPLTDSANETAYAVHPYFHQADLTNTFWDTNFGNFAASYPVLSTEWTAVANSATSGTTYYCDAKTGTQSVMLMQYFQSHNLGMIGYAWDFTGSVFGSAVYYANGVTAKATTSSFSGKSCGDAGYGMGLTMQDWFTQGTVPAMPQ